ncbi:hypothetical protein MKY98_17640 [Paenibacillus sp. FSL M8-0228]|uniref:hypothetical protein n=2 Tax=Paenibacillus TaxID=44249 RepID=UPI00083D5CB7|nr:MULTISPECIES: hypothetical protein [Paenibacillus]MBO3286247.1 hypothetical protein [Paenibacillus polymyxa]MBP1312057.1 hypothetical protein [Paenibacillus sp. 1182]ODB58119.1 hypothetical protein A7311_13330 [Paenibacillus polymyxa]
MRMQDKPIVSIIGLGLFSLTLVVHICFRSIRTMDVGMGILLSLVNAVFLVFTLLWGVLGAVEFSRLMSWREKIKKREVNEEVDLHKYKKKIKIYLCINVIYLLLVICQLGYVIYRWDEVNV